MTISRNIRNTTAWRERRAEYLREVGRAGRVIAEPRRPGPPSDEERNRRAIHLIETLERRVFGREIGL